MILGIYGAGGLGREVFELATAINDKQKRWKEIIFIDDGIINFNPRNLRILKYKNLQSNKNLSDIEICIAIGEPDIRKTLYDKLVEKDFNIATLIHPDVVISESTKICSGVIICKYLSITCDITIGNNVYIHPNVCIGHDAVIGDNTVISSYVDVAGNCNVGANAFIAINVCMKQGVNIGSETIVGMGSVVMNDIPKNVIALGNPARPMKINEDRRVFK